MYNKVCAKINKEITNCVPPCMCFMYIVGNLVATWIICEREKRVLYTQKELGENSRTLLYFRQQSTHYHVDGVRVIVGLSLFYFGLVFFHHFPGSPDETIPPHVGRRSKSRKWSREKNYFGENAPPKIASSFKKRHGCNIHTHTHEMIFSVVIIISAHNTPTY